MWRHVGWQLIRNISKVRSAFVYKTDCPENGGGIFLQIRIHSVTSYNTVTFDIDDVYEILTFCAGVNLKKIIRFCKASIFVNWNVIIIYFIFSLFFPKSTMF